MANQFDEFLYEVEEDLKREKLNKMMKVYGPYVLAGVILLILAVAIYAYWNHSQLKSQEARSDIYMKAVQLREGGKNAEAEKELNALISKGGDYATLAEFEKASLLAAKPETREEAAKVYSQMIKSRTIDRRYRSLAVIFYVQLQLDSGNPEELMKLLQESSVGTNLWPGLTSELTALVALRLGETEHAKSILKDLLNSKDTSAGVRARANALLSTLEHKT